jgi:SAM-dependent methyltransferase
MRGTPDGGSDLPQNNEVGQPRRSGDLWPPFGVGPSVWGMDADETHALGYERVDDDPNVSVLLETMEATGRWEAILRLRVWERKQLNLTPGQRLLDVGCGLGEAALTLADDLGSDGEIVGIDASAEMIAGARSRVRTAKSRADSPSATLLRWPSPTAPSTPLGPNGLSSG